MSIIDQIHTQSKIQPIFTNLCTKCISRHMGALWAGSICISMSHWETPTFQVSDKIYNYFVFHSDTK